MEHASDRGAGRRDDDDVDEHEALEAAFGDLQQPSPREMVAVSFILRSVSPLLRAIDSRSWTHGRKVRRQLGI